MKIFGDKIVSSVEAKYYINEDSQLSYNDRNSQGSYNLEKDFFNYVKNKNILIQDPNLEYSRKSKDGNAYVLNGYEFKLGPGILWLIGKDYENIENKFIASVNGTNNKFQFYRAVYKNLGEEYDWFVDLFDKNLSGNNLIFEIDEVNKILTFDIRFNSINRTIDYEDIVIDEENVVESNYSQNSDDIDYPFNRIFFGAPGTGKSFALNNQREEMLGMSYKNNYERVTFHPDYSYAHFVGTYKPVSKHDGKISYEYVPGPFMRILVESLKNPYNPYILIIEEINRANVAAVFGDIFQLLDRNSEGISEYPIQTSEDMRNYLHKELGGDIIDYKTIHLPNNLFLWATMNSADQGVYMMDTAFKRRWDFSYIGINTSEDKINYINLHLGKDIINWNELRKAINNELLSYNINEDKLIGPFFIPLEYLNDNDFIDIFKNKVIMYLFEDVAKQRRQSLFNKDIKEGEYLLYSEICEKVDTEGIKIFCQNIINNVNSVNSGD